MSPSCGRINVRMGGAAKEAGVKNDTEVPAEKHKKTHGRIFIAALL